MIFKVYLMRRHGHRRSWKEIQVGPFYIGTITTHTVRYKEGDAVVASLLNNGSHYSQVRDLYEPTLLGFAPNAFQLRGFERIDHPQGDYGAVQEWHVEQPSSDEIIQHASSTATHGTIAASPLIT